ncbi:hypothetical protein ABZV31_18205 [Streptomyces sp. NPDC005202]|uniref:hypothetical protein n=1 Tax=Streptomyces sp. NPDC005202 TaxID=3157021 RepID=UPI0033AAEC84
MDKELSSDVPPGKRAFARTLQALCRQLLPDETTRAAGKPLTQENAAKRLHSNPSSLSRFLSARTVPSLEFAEHLYKQACADAGGEDLVDTSVDELRALHSQAVAERRCRKCAKLSAKADLLTQQLEEAATTCAALRQEAAELESLRKEVAALRSAVSELKAARAGLRARLAVRAASTPLPVPGRRGDRQRMHNDVAAVRQLASQAEKLQGSGREGAALTLLCQTTEALSPVEMAGVLALLRKQQRDDLADNLIHIYGRDQRDQDVMHASLALHEQGSPDDAGALLRAALG